jgi:hypothetical protein
MMEYTYYQHHKGQEKVWVQEDLLGIHKMHCLCYSCKKFNPENRDWNCKIANLVFAVNRVMNITTPVWECPEFEEKESEE